MARSIYIVRSKYSHRWSSEKSHSPLSAEDGLTLQARFRVELPGYPILGDGKGDNQNHAIPFMRGVFTQCIDANQGAYFDSWHGRINVQKHWIRIHIDINIIILDIYIYVHSSYWDWQLGRSNESHICFLLRLCMTNMRSRWCCCHVHLVAWHQKAEPNALGSQQDALGKLWYFWKKSYLKEKCKLIYARHKTPKQPPTSRIFLQSAQLHRTRRIPLEEAGWQLVEAHRRLSWAHH